MKSDTDMNLTVLGKPWSIWVWSVAYRSLVSTWRNPTMDKVPRTLKAWRPSPRPSLTPGPHISEVRHCGQGVLGRFQPLSSAVDVFSKSWLYPTMSAWLPTGVPIYSLSSMSCAGPKAWSDLDVPRWSLEFPMACALPTSEPTDTVATRIYDW